MKTQTRYPLFILLMLPLCLANAEVTFTRVDAGELGQSVGRNSTIAWGDYDGDGYVDLFVGMIPGDSSTPSQPNRLFHNEGDGTFTRVLDGGLANDQVELTPFQEHLVGVAWADFENDGDLDLYTAYNAWYDHAMTDRFYLNNGDGTFTRGGQDWITSEFTVQPTWGDFDNDGLLDLFVTRHTEGTCLLYHHQPDDSMLPIEVPVGPDGTHCYGVVTSDVDLDGDIDLLIGSLKVLFKNEGDLEFTHNFFYRPNDVHGISAADYNNDGYPDIAVVSWSASSHIYENFHGRPLPSPFPTPWKELSYTSFPPTDVSWTWSLAWGDYDNDGYVDLLIPTATDPVFGDVGGETNRLYHNEGDGTFTLVAEGALVNDAGMSYCAAWADYDNDGDLDVALPDGGGKGGYDIRPPFAPVALYRNDGGNDNHWLTLTLVGTLSNRSAIGAKVYAYANIDGVERQQMREVVSSSGYISQNDMRVHFGLGDATIVDTLRIEWPSGFVQELKDVQANQFMTIEEDAQDWAGYPVVNSDMDVDTGDFMGWINVYHGDYIWSYMLGAWIYCPQGHVSEYGAWVYMPK